MAYDYAKIAGTAYEKMKECFAEPGCSDYWKLGNAFDTMTDYLIWWPAEDSEIAKTVHDRYQLLLNPPAGYERSDCWYDDYGWWGIASAKAYDPRYTKLFPGDYQNYFKQIAHDCWNIMNKGKPNPKWSYKGAPNVWDNRDNGHPDESYWNHEPNWSTPRIGKGVGSGCQGVWQYDIFHVPRPKKTECSPTNPCDPTTTPFGPYQNTVVNGLYLLLALRLYNVGKDPTTLQPARDEYGFLEAWFNYKLQDDSLLLDFGDNTLLVRERVTSYAELNGRYPSVQKWNDTRDTCWAGDQGLVLAGLIDYLKVVNDPKIPALAVRLVGAVATHMTKNSVIQTSHNSVGSADPGDYKCGPGIFMRGLLYAYSQPNSPIKPMIDQNGFRIRDVLLASTDAACKTVSNDLFDNLNVLATLTTAKGLGIIKV